jgi:hypothetical protein
MRLIKILGSILRKINTLFHWVMLQYNSLVYNPLYFYFMKRKADNLHKIHGYQFHVMPLTKNIIDNNVKNLSQTWRMCVY